MKVSPRGLVSIRRKRKVKPCERIEKTGRKIYNFGLSLSSAKKADGDVWVLEGVRVGVGLGLGVELKLT